MTDIASLGLRVDSSQPAAAVPVLDNLTAAAGRAAAAEEKLAASSRTAGQAQSEAIAIIQRNTAQASTPSTLLQLIEKQNAAQRAFVPIQQNATAAMGAATLSARQYSQALRQLPSQITDITVGLASGQSPFLVLLQQGGQLKDSFGGVGAAVRAVLGSISPAALAVGGLAAAGALAAKAFNDGEREAYEFQKAIVLSGNAAGVTADELSSMADQISAVAGTRGEAADALNAAVASGQITRTLLRDIAAAAVEIQHAAGTPIEETIKQFAALGEKPLQAAESLNKQAHFLTVELYEQIRALDEQGRTSEAAAVAQKGFLDAERERADRLRESLGTLPKLWDDIKTAAANAWAEVARAPSLQEQLDSINRQLKAPALENNLGVTTQADPEALLRRRAELNRLIQSRSVEARAAQDRAQALAIQKQRDELSDAIDKGSVATAAAQLQATLAGVQRGLSASQAALGAYESAIEAQHRAGLISDREYYATRRELIQADVALQVDALKAENATLAAREAAIRTAADRAAGRATPAKAFEIEAEAARQILDLETKRKDNLTEIGVITARASVATAETVQEEGARLRSLAAGYQSARDAAQAYLDTLERRQRQDLDGLGRGDRERQRTAGRESIVDRFDQQRRDLQNARAQSELQGTFNADAKRRFDQQLAIIDEFQGKALHSFDDYWSELTEKQGSFFVGASEAFRNYLDEAQNTAGQVAAALSRALDNATDTLLKFVTTGKGSFKELANSIIADILRIQLQKSLSTVLNSALGSIFGEAFGGDIAPVKTTVTKLASGTNYVPRDNFPALLHQGEAVVPRAMNPYAGGQGWGGGGPQITFHTEIHGAPGMDMAAVGALLDQRDAALEAQFQESIRRGRWAPALARA